MATIRVKNPSQGGEKWITIPTKIQSEADHIVTNKGQGDLYLSNDGTYKDVIKSANDYTDKQIELITGSSPDILETLKELSNQTSDNKDFINVLNKSIATKLDKTANAVSASKLATPIKLWGNDFDGSQSVYGALYASNGNRALTINNNNVTLGNINNPSYIYGSSLYMRGASDNVAIYVDQESKVGIGTANPQKKLHVNGEAQFDQGFIAKKLSLGVVTLHRDNDNGSSAILFENNTGTLGYLGISSTSIPYYWDAAGIAKVILHEGNCSNYALPITGGTVTGRTNFYTKDSTPVVVSSTSTNAAIAFKNSNTADYAYLYYGPEGFIVTDDGWRNAYKIYHEGNFNPNNYLPLSGGVISTEDRSIEINRTQEGGFPYIMYSNKNNALGSIGVSVQGHPVFYKNGDTNWKKIWYAGNDGEGSGLDADLLDGLHGSNYVINTYSQKQLGQIATAGFYRMHDSSVHKDLLQGFDYGNMIVARNNTSDSLAQILFNMHGNRMVVRGGSTNTGSSDYFGNNPWNQVAFTDSDITGNAASATKLATPVKLWGNDFDGSSNVTGDIYLISKTSTGTNSDSAVIRFNGTYGVSSQGPSIRAINEGPSYGRKRLSIFQHDANDYSTENEVVSILPNGNVGIGITDPQYKLRVEGKGYFTEDILIKNSKSFAQLDTKGDSCSLISLGTGNEYVIGYGVATRQYPTYLDGNKLLFRTSSDHQTRMVINDFGNVGIGTTDPQYKLDVNGSIAINNNYPLISKDSNGVGLRTHFLNSNNNLFFGIDMCNVGYSSYVCGYSIIFQTGTNRISNVFINESGNVTIGSSDLASNNYKLYVDGHIATHAFVLPSTGKYRKATISHSNDTLYIQSALSNGSATNGKMVLSGTNLTNLDLFSVKAKDSLIQGPLSVRDQITSGELVDWYGVSWSEDSSDPTCTRIGNMALHRSLPIQNAMKGYVICNHNTGDKRELILPMDDNWIVKYGADSNSNLSDAVRNKYTETMVKIPEFWYIDDYESSTKTHNLKISQTAKAGWCHHKEAYVGAYEGYNDGAYYRSTKGVTPTVSVSRTTLRPLARANGYENEYKWNIYTYEEHRAICHLFLVEYATRNSQAPVNTELTSDGFKQGGLGSGCTTGTVTINGQTTYSFIPTGTTDSLGNGSGQVAYTVTQTDADGNEIGTVTRYANRYRGIENPFGHIWKHVDDIVNVYNAETTYKAVYKCNKPEHFATNKNAKYKPFCSFPGGSKMQGWSKEIKATINCDFFKYSVGGSESTYWCDYNYDNDDTSEHGLLAGGGSGNGGRAGLFSLSLNSGVGNSHATVGSRLTYLPWAE